MPKKFEAFIRRLVGGKKRRGFTGLTEEELRAAAGLKGIKNSGQLSLGQLLAELGWEQSRAERYFFEHLEPKNWRIETGCDS